MKQAKIAELSATIDALRMSIEEFQQRESMYVRERERDREREIGREKGESILHESILQESCMLHDTVKRKEQAIDELQRVVHEEGGRVKLIEAEHADTLQTLQTLK